MSQETPERLALTAPEVARLLGVSARHVLKLRASGRFPEPIKLGRSTRWLRDDVIAYLESLKR